MSRRRAGVNFGVRNKLVKGAGRSVSLYLLRPIQYLLDGALFAAGLLLLLRFGLEFYHSPALASLGWVVRFRQISDPVLGSIQAGLSHIIPISPNGATVLPLILSILVWIFRYFLISYCKRVRLALEEPSAVPAMPAVASASTPPRTMAASPALSDGVRRIGRYEIQEEIGRGAMGAVYRALDPQIGRTVALKVILTRDLPPEDLAIYKERFYREARAAGKMSHPGIITVHDIAEDAYGTPYLVMEYVEGKTLDRLISRDGGERMPVPQCLEIAIQVAEALEYAHRQGVIHRDIKPANILVTPGGQAKIADFGVAKLVGTQYTQAGAVVGTPAFMSPEQLTGATVDARCDLFSFGVVLYWMLTGEKPFSGDTITAITYKVVHTSPLPPKQLNPALPAEYDTVLLKCLAKDAAARYQNARELITDLQALKAGRPLAAQPSA
jgi:tRNA A-37 threonylcarbamoyl transferase component Bud32